METKKIQIKQSIDYINKILLALPDVNYNDDDEIQDMEQAEIGIQAWFEKYHVSNDYLAASISGYTPAGKYFEYCYSDGYGHIKGSVIIGYGTAGDSADNIFNTCDIGFDDIDNTAGLLLDLLYQY